MIVKQIESIGREFNDYVVLLLFLILTITQFRLLRYISLKTLPFWKMAQITEPVLRRMLIRRRIEGQMITDVFWQELGWKGTSVLFNSC